MNTCESDLGICCPHHPKVHFLLGGARILCHKGAEYPKNSNTLLHTFLTKLCSVCSYFLKYFVEWQPVYNLIRVLLQEQCDLGLHCLHMPFNQKLRVQNSRSSLIWVCTVCICHLIRNLGYKILTQYHITKFQHIR